MCGYWVGERRRGHICGQDEFRDGGGLVAMFAHRGM